MRIVSLCEHMGLLAQAVVQVPPLRVLAVFERSLYLENAGGTLVCLVQKGLEPGPLNMLCAPWPAADVLPVPGQIAGLSAGLLHWSTHTDRGQGRQVAIDLTKAAVWQPPSKPDNPTVPDILAGLEAFARYLTALPLPQNTDGLRSLVLPLCAHSFAGLEAAVRQGVNPLEHTALEGLAALWAWLRGAEESLPIAHISGLLGLGPGLTPSGDDVLGGVLLALHELGQKHKAHLLAMALAPYMAHTNRISRAHLGAAAQGYGAEVLHMLLFALCGKQNALASVCERLDGVGHSSGWDACLGVVLTLHAMATVP